MRPCLEYSAIFLGVLDAPHRGPVFVSFTTFLLKPKPRNNAERLRQPAPPAWHGSTFVLDGALQNVGVGQSS